MKELYKYIPMICLSIVLVVEIINKASHLLGSTLLVTLIVAINGVSD